MTIGIAEAKRHPMKPRLKKPKAEFLFGGEGVVLHAAHPKTPVM